MDSSEEEDDFLTHEWITPLSKMNSVYQSKSEKGIRKLCCELLDLKDAMENLCGNSQSKYLAFQRVSIEVAEMEHELIELHKHVSSQRIFVQDLMTGVCRELEEWNRVDGKTSEVEEDPLVCDPLLNEFEIHRMAFLENIDVLFAEHKVEEALEALDAEEKSSSEKTILEDQLVETTEQPSVGICELKKALFALLQLGKGPLAQQLLLKEYGSRLRKKIDGFLPLCLIYEETYPLTLPKLVFSTILLTAKESGLIFGDMPVYSNRIVQWAEWEIESFIRLVKENAPSSETVTALRATSICVQASFNQCSILESQGLKLSKLLMVLLQQYVEEEMMTLPPQIVSAPPGLTTSSSDSMHAGSGTRFIFLVKDTMQQLTPEVISHFGATVLTKISHFFDEYVELLIKALPGPSEDKNLAENKEYVYYKAKTDSQQLALMVTVFTVADELLPMAVSRIWSGQSELMEPGSGPAENV
ncbi:hypothetical protein GIB67_020479 [Kingdonia uniflora]|uniref:Exocyst component Exo84 C-terminal domain-containing protein n=1 Tax=Kingdonia uniflora TaxID=39325 RepID=A0A7J7LUT5_9MAGN|nr:hypothetical protein GIB67_020479 [Kingdonia uniflora]